MAIAFTVTLAAQPMHFEKELTSIASRRQIRQTKSEEELRVKNQRAALKVVKCTTHDHYTYYSGAEAANACVQRTRRHVDSWARWL